MALYGETLSKPFRVVVEGAVRPGLLGGKGSRGLSVGTAVRFEIENPDNGAVFDSNGQPVLDVVTDSAGTARALLRVGQVPGDIMVRAFLPDHTDLGQVEFRAVAGAIGE